jgi:hypothetical protein
MKAIKIVLVSFVILFFFSSNGFAFRCGSSLVTTGNTKIQVSETCGAPTSKEIICPKKSYSCPSIVEIWYYNCGGNDYIYALTFEDGKLTKETAEGSGKGKSDCLGK